MAQLDGALSLIPVRSLPRIRPGADIPKLILGACHRERINLMSNDIVIVAQKIVSCAANLIVDTNALQPSDEAKRLSVITGKESKIVEAVLRESTEVIAASRGVLLTRHKSGCILANAGLDRSNLPTGAEEGALLALPRDCDYEADNIRSAMEAQAGISLGVVICDSWGRPFRLGTVGFALGVSGLPAIVDLRGRSDLNGRLLEASIEAVADGLAAAANLVMGQGNESIPVVIVRGLRFHSKSGCATDLLRPAEQDLFVGKSLQ